VAASVLGFGFVSERPDSPHLKLAGVRAALYFAFAEHDEIIAPTVRAALQAALAAQGVGADIVVHPGVRHPYAFPDRKVHDREAAEADWTRIFALFERHLRAGS